MRIAIIGSRGIPRIYSGVERFICDFGPRLATRGHEVWVYGLPKFTVGDSFRGVRLIACPHIPVPQLSIISNALLATLHALAHGADVIHYQNIGPSCLAPLARCFGTRTVTTFHSLNWHHSKWTAVERWLIRHLASIAVRAPDAAVAVAKQHSAYLEQQCRRHVDHIPNGIDCDAVIETCLAPDQALPRGAFVLYTGRISPEKGIETLIEAFHSWSANLELVICGDDETPYARRLKEISDSRIAFLGHVEPAFLDLLYSRALMFVLPSESEGLSLSLLEAMRSGTPVVVTAIPENLDVVEDCALTFEVGDSEGLLRAMATLYVDPIRRQNLAERAKRLVQEKYSWEYVIARYEKLYEGGT